VKKLDSDFVIVDIKRGRKALARKIEAGKRFRVVVEVELDTQHGWDDGTSIEFSGKVINASIEAAS